MFRRLFNWLTSLTTALITVLAAARALSTLRWLRIVQELPRPLATFAAAQQRVAILNALETSARLSPGGGTRLLHHGTRTERAIVLLHGFTSGPQQFDQMAQRLHARGHNVLVARMPGHGLRDRSAQSLATLTASDLVAAANEAVDIAGGLGERVSVVGFSMGGILAGWLAHYRADVHEVAIISAPYHMHAIDTRLLGLLPPLLRFLPNRFQWWDPERRNQRAAPQHAYPRFPLHALASLIHLSNAVLAHANRRAPLVERLLVVSNPTDEAVDSSGLATLTARWRRHGAAVREFTFDETWALRHDIIDPTQPTQQVERVYPVLESLLFPVVERRDT